MKSQSLEWRPLHGSLPLVFLLVVLWVLNLAFCTGVGDGRDVLVECWEWTGGMGIGDFVRLCNVASRERL